MKFPNMRPATWIAVTAALAMSAACGSDSADGPTPQVVQVSAASTSFAPASATADKFADLEKSYDTRLGVYVLDTETGRSVTWRSGERFAFASTIKAPLAGAVLDQVSRKDLDRVIRYDESDLVPYSPITEKHVEDGMSLRDVIDAALRYSDNTAANLMFEEIGGPAKLDRALDRLGDRITDPERTEPELNTAIPGDIRDTTTPKAIAKTTAKYVEGKVLPRYDRELLRTGLINNTTGDELIRAGVPDSWVVGDKTGSADYGVRNDVAVAYPPGRAPVLIAVLSSRNEIDEPYDNAVIAEATRVAIGALR